MKEGKERQKKKKGGRERKLEKKEVTEKNEEKRDRKEIYYKRINWMKGNPVI